MFLYYKHTALNTKAFCDGDVYFFSIPWAAELSVKYHVHARVFIDQVMTEEGMKFLFIVGAEDLPLLFE